MTTQEEAALRAEGFELVRSRDNRFVVTERENALRAAQNGLVTAPHATADEAWRETYKRRIGSH